MPVNAEECVKLVCTLVDEKNLKVAVTESLQGGLIAGAGAVGGGLLLGPVGIAVGATVGGIIAAASSSGFMSVAEVLQCMAPENKERLADVVRKIIQGIQYSDAISLAAIVMANQAMKRDILLAARSYLEIEMKMQIIE